jgi:hypothetical protein
LSKNLKTALLLGSVSVLTFLLIIAKYWFLKP